MGTQPGRVERQVCGGKCGNQTVHVLRSKSAGRGERISLACGESLGYNGTSLMVKRANPLSH